MDKFLDVEKNKQNNKSKLMDSKSDFPQKKDKLSTIILENNKEEENIIKDKLNNKKNINKINNLNNNKIDEKNKNDKRENTISYISNPLKDSKYKIDNIQEDLNNNKLFDTIKNDNSQFNYDINRETNYSTITTQDNKRNNNQIKRIANNNIKKIPRNKNIKKLSGLNNLNLIKKNKEKSIKKKEIKINNDENKQLNCNDNNKDNCNLNKININEINNLFNENNIDNNETHNDKVIKNDLFDEENLNELPKDYDENFNDLYTLIKQIKFRNVILNIEGIFTTEGKEYMKYKDKFDKVYDTLFIKKKNSFSNYSVKTKKFFEATSNTKTNYSSSKKHNDIRPNAIFEDLKFEN